jgi:GAF domain-containing protein
VIASGQPLVISDGNTEAAELGIIPRFHDDEDAESPSWTWVGVPMIAGGQVLGVLCIQDEHRSHAFPPSTIDLITTLANSAGVALENARLFAETKRLLAETDRRAAELAVINDVQEALAAELDVAGIAEVVGEKIRAIFDAQAIFIGVIDAATRTVHVPYWLLNGRRLVPEPIPLGHGLTGHVVSTRRPLVINRDGERRYAELGAIHKADDDMAKSWVGVPMIAGDEVVGVISMQDPDREDAYDEAAVSLLTTLANSTGVALDNARLFAETTRLLEETDRRAVELDVINRVQQVIAARQDVQGVVDVVGDSIRELFGAQSAYIAVVDRPAGLIRFPYFFTRGQQVPDEAPIALGEGLTSRVVATRQPLLLDHDIAEVGDELGCVVDSVKPLTWLGVPMIVGDEVIGVACLQDELREYAYTEANVALLTTLAASTGAAIENARLFGETTRLLGETDQRAGRASDRQRDQPGPRLRAGDRATPPGDRRADPRDVRRRHRLRRAPQCGDRHHRVPVRARGGHGGDPVRPWADEPHPRQPSAAPDQHGPRCPSRRDAARAGGRQGAVLPRCPDHRRRLRDRRAQRPEHGPGGAFR